MMPIPEVAQTQQAFDAAAPVYDAMYERLPGIRRIRSTTSALYLKYFPRNGSLLEINCGTGIDAVFLAERTMNVLATDASPRMVEEVRKKVDERGLGGFVEPRHLAFSQLGSLRGRVFDGAYSNLGGLNCTNRLESVATDLGGLVKPGGFFIATVMPSFCLWETVAFATRFRWRDAFRRKSGEGTLASLHGARVRTYYHSARAFSAAFAEYFEPVKTVGLAVLLPPPNFEHAYALLGRSLHLLESVDEAVAGLPLFRSIGDHYVMVLRRKPW
jgi:ubiquinone/menaquinone biosynthesis C-methylase UbiE